MKGSLISVEGLDGAGKSTAIAALVQQQLALGVRCRVEREPGGTPWGELLRSLLKGETLSSSPLKAPSAVCAALIQQSSCADILDGVINNYHLDSKDELLLFNAARAELCSNVIIPALAAGEVVILDRFTDSTLAYQGYGRGLDLNTVRDVCEKATSGLVPDLTILLNISLPTRRRRLEVRGGADRIERSDEEFFERVADGFLEMATAEPGRIIIVDGEMGVSMVADAVMNAVSEHLS